MEKEFVPYELALRMKKLGLGNSQLRKLAKRAEMVPPFLQLLFIVVLLFVSTNESSFAFSK